MNVRPQHAILSSRWLHGLQATPTRVALPLAVVAVSVTCGRVGWSPTLPGFAALTAGLTIAGVSDTSSRRLPKKVVYPTFLFLLAALTAAAGFDDRWAQLGEAGAAAAVLFTVFASLHLASPKALAFGDVRLALPVGLGLGWYGPSAALLTARRIDRTATVPLGTYLAAGAVLTIWALGSPA